MGWLDHFIYSSHILFQFRELFVRIKYDHHDNCLFDTVNLPSYVWVFLFGVTRTMQSNKNDLTARAPEFPSALMRRFVCRVHHYKARAALTDGVNSQMKFCSVTTLSNISAAKWPLRNTEPLTNIYILLYHIVYRIDYSRHFIAPPTQCPSHTHCKPEHLFQGW